MASLFTAMLCPRAPCSSLAICPAAAGHSYRNPTVRRCIGPETGVREKRARVVGAVNGPPNTFLTLEEAGLIEMSKLDMHERFLARLTVSSLNLLRVVSEQEGVPIEELNAGLICDWFVKDKAKRDKDINTATLKWDAGPEW